MPELPEVETVRRGLEPALTGRRFKAVKLARPDLRFPFPERFVERLEGTRVERLGRRAKFLMAELSTGETLTMHLGMTGRFTISGEGFEVFAHSVSPAPQHDHVTFSMQGGIEIIFNDPRRFGFMELFAQGEAETSARFSELGPEPLSNAFSAISLTDAIKGKKSPIKTVLLDQRIVAGLGNIYVCEALFRAGIAPTTRAGDISAKRLERLTAHIKDVLQEAVDAGGSSISDFASTSGALGYFQHNFLVYGRENKPCSVCGAAILRIPQSGRSTFYCGVCQS